MICEKSLIGNEVWGIFLTLCSPLETRNLQPMIRSLNNPIVFPWFHPLVLKLIWTLNSFFLNVAALINRIHLKNSDVESQPQFSNPKLHSPLTQRINYVSLASLFISSQVHISKLLIQNLFSQCQLLYTLWIFLTSQYRLQNTQEISSQFLWKDI